MVLEHLTDIGATTPDPKRALHLSRRSFLQAGAAAGGGLMLRLSLPFVDGQAEAAGAETFAPNAFIRISSDGQIVLVMPYVEMGQGIYTSISMLIAEELEVGLDQVRVEHAPPNPKLYGNPALAGVQATGGSTSIRATWKPMREAGAVARTMLMAAAAKRWNVDAASCRAQGGEVLHSPTGGRLKYGELAADAALMPVPQNVALKPSQDFTLIGTRAKRLDTPAKVNGTAMFGIDVRPPGVKIATLAQSPVFGGRLKSVDDKAAMAVKGVRQVVRLEDAVAVIADHMGAAKKGLAALVIEWDDGPHAKLTTDDIAAELEKATLQTGPVAQNIGDVDKAMAGAAKKVEAIYQVPFLAHAAMEPMNCTVHVRKDDCEVWVGNQAIARAQETAAKNHGPAIGQGHGPQSSDRRRIRAPTGDRRRHPRGSDRHAGGWSGEGGVDPRGRHPARHVPALLVRPVFRRTRCEWNAGRVEPSFRRLFGDCEMAAAGLQKRPRPGQHRWRD
jgi:isoquinoline 1-oxidoreductase beta subunit